MGEEMRRVTRCASCDGVSENSILGMLLVRRYGEDLVRLGVVHRPECPELQDEEGECPTTKS